MARISLSRLLALGAGFLDRRVGWHRLPRFPLGLGTLAGLRAELRRRNLYDAPSGGRPDLPPAEDQRHAAARTADGTRNDLADPLMGSAGMPFGRNVPPEHAYPENHRDEDGFRVLEEGPDPRAVSRALMTRDAFKPATGLNLLAAAWLQFMVRDWFSHGKGTTDNMWRLKKEADDPLSDDALKVPRTPDLPTDGAAPPAYANTETHWWDGSQIYGSSEDKQAAVRSGEGGRLRLPGGRLPDDLLDAAAEEPGWWVGLALMTTLFAREHNAICDHLRKRYPSWSDDELFDKARLINAALMAKIHTVEWTPAILGHPTLRFAMRANWWGLAGEQIHKLYGRISESEIVSGIPGSGTDHFGVPYSLTEEFVAVYKMHPLIPDHFSLRSAANDGPLGEHTLRDVQDKNVRGLLGRTRMQDWLYSFGIAHPGEITLHNYPRFLQEFRRPDGGSMDLAATDILRARELGVPRYNEFRRLLRLPPARTFEELTDNPKWAEEIRSVYEGDIDRVDLMVGLFAERRPEGFGFSDTAFRIFILMASRRLNSDRFFTTDYTPRVYTQEGLDWIGINDMSSVLRRHFRDLEPALRTVGNAFAPWGRV